MIAKSKRTGVGMYSLAEAARLVGAPQSSVWRWSRDHDLLPRFFPRDGSTLSFVELVEVLFIKMFRDEGVSLTTIRQASKAAAKKFDTRYPFAVKRFDTDGKTIFGTMLNETTDEEVLEDIARGQMCFLNVLKPFFHKLEFGSDQEVSRYWPMNQKGKEGRVVLDPLRKFGRPIDAESGICTRVLFDAFNAGGGQGYPAVAEQFGVPVAAVEAAVAFERSLTA